MAIGKATKGVLGLMSMLGVAGPIEAQDYKLQRERCGLDSNRRLPPGPGAIDACTVVIQSGKETPRIVAQAFINRGNAYRMNNNDIGRAIADYDEAIRLQPDFALAFATRGFVYLFDKRELARAITDFDRAIDLDPGFANAFYYRGVAYLDKNEYDRAIADFDRAIRLRPKFSLALRDRGQAKIAKGDRKGGEADLAEAERVGAQEPVRGP